MAHKTPTTDSDIKSAAIDVTPLIKENIIKPELNGITIPTGAEAVLTAAANRLLKPSFRCKTTITPTIAVDAAIAELEIDTITTSPIIFICANDPYTFLP